MMLFFQTIFSFFFAQSLFIHLTAENLVLRQQLAIMKRKKFRPKLRPLDRIFWRWKSRKKRIGRPGINCELKKLIRQMAKENPWCGAPRIHGELLKLGVDASERTVSRLMPNRKFHSSGQKWRTFLKNHSSAICAMDFFVVPTASFRVLYVLVTLSHERREVIHFNVTDHPTAIWTLQQIKEAFPLESAPKYLLRDRDGIYGKAFRQSMKDMGIKEVITSPRSPWQNGHVERLIGSIRRDCLDQIFENHLRRILTDYFAYYNLDRTHYGIAKDAPIPRAIQARPETCGKVVALPRVGGLHHRYEWRKAA